ncbi:MAG: hypothetical protein GX458_18985 [Phyllobacteriaceae bacterium]|nr:hypothetical protein [Phyllobacteriaceae bacterium]
MWLSLVTDFLRFALRRLTGWMVMLLALAAVGLVLLLYPVRPQPRESLVVEATAPDAHSVVRVMRHDNGMGFGLGEEWGVVLVDRESRWFGRKVETVAEFDSDRLDDRAVRVEWRDANHAVVTLPGGTRIISRGKPAAGLAVDLRTAP